MSRQQWKFQVQGTLVRAGTGVVICQCEAIIESGVRDETSPLNLVGVGPIARPDSTGAFRSWFVTSGSDTPISYPATVSVFLRAAPGQWVPYVVSVDTARCHNLSSNEALLEIGQLQLPQRQALYAEP